MHNLVPRFILERYAQRERDSEGPLFGRFLAAALFTDISGFTTITDALMQHGQHGAEVLASIMCAVFEPLVRSVYEQGGFITGFAGDAFTAVFPAPDDEPAAATLPALAAAWQGQQHMTTQVRHSTPYGDFSLSAKMGLAAGEITWGIVISADGTRASYYFRGPAIDGCAAAEKLASPGEIILDAALREALPGLVAVESVENHLPDGHYRLTALAAPLPPPQPVERPPADPELMARFFPREIVTPPHSGESQGEFRHVVTLFIRLPTVRTETQLAIFMRSLFALQARYGGLLNRLDFGDKGSHLLLFWGAPVTFENDIARALNFILGLQTQTSIPISAGVTYRIAHAGFIGSPLYEEYTCYGRGANLAARFMTAAPRGEIWVDEQVARRVEQRFEFDFEGEIALKGFADKQKVYVLGERKEDIESFYQGEMVGREAELEQLAGFVAPLWQGQYAGAMVVWGEAGIGKSRLVHEFQTCKVFETEQVLWALCQTDQILQEPFNPLRYWLRCYFGQSTAQSEARNKRSLNRKLDRLIDATADEALAGELDRTRSFLGALLGLRWPDSLYEQLDAQRRYENTLIGLTTLLQAQSLQQPLILHLEDAQWLDEDSKAFLPRLARMVTAGQGRSIADDALVYPIAIIATARPVEGPSLLGKGLVYQEIEVGGLSHAEVARLAEALLEGSAAPALLDLLVARAESNPFFAEQILLYLREQGLIELQEDEWHIVGTQRDAPRLPTDVRAMLVARLDRLAQEVREVVQTAAVLGREFEVQLLSQILRGDETLMDKVVAAEQEDIWAALSQLRYLFKHTLLRDTAYEMQLRARRRELHQLAAEALESLHTDGCPPRYGEIAYHYEAAYRQGQAGLQDKACTYLEKAGRQAARGYENAAAVDFFSRALELTPEADIPKRYALLLAREKIYDLQGARAAQCQDLVALGKLAGILSDARKQAKVALRQSSYAEAISDYPAAIVAAQEAIHLAQASRDMPREAAGYLHWGRALWLQGDYEAAQKVLEQALALAQAAKLRQVEADSLHNLGDVSRHQSNYTKARTCYEQSLRICRKIGHRRGEGRAAYGIGIVFVLQGDDAGARTHFEQALRTYREIGDRHGEGSALNLLGVVSDNQGDYIGAKDYYEQALRIYCEIGDRMGEGGVLFHLGSFSSDRGDYNGARDYFGQALRISREIGSRDGESIMLHQLGIVFRGQGDYTKAVDYYEHALGIYRETGNRQDEGRALAGLACVSINRGGYAEASAYIEQALGICRETGDQQTEGWVLSNLGRLYYHLGDYEAAREYNQQALLIAQDLDDRRTQGYAWTHLGHVLTGLGDLAAAADAYRQALDIRRELDQHNLAMESLAGHVQVLLIQDAPEQAQVYIEEILDYLETRTLDGTDEPLRIYLTCYQVLRANKDPRAQDILNMAHTLLQERAAKITDEKLRRSFLENIAAHREIIGEWYQSNNEEGEPCPNANS